MLSASYLNRIKEISLAMFNSEHPENFHITFIVYKSKILSIGVNDSKTSPINLLNPKTDKTGKNIAHLKGRCSEWQCIRKAKNTTNVSFRKITLVNIRIRRDKKFGLAKPCESCRSLLDFFNIHDVIYTDNSGNFVSE